MGIGTSGWPSSSNITLGSQAQQQGAIVQYSWGCAETKEGVPQWAELWTPCVFERKPPPPQQQVQGAKGGGWGGW